MSLLKTPWFALVELPVNAGTANQWVNFPDQPNLTTLIDQEVSILGVELIPLGVLSVAPSGNANAPLTELVKATLVLVDEDKQKVYEFPVLNLNRSYPDAANDFPHVQDLQLFDNLKKIAWTKSGIQFMSPVASAPYSILFGVHYSKMDRNAIK